NLATLARNTSSSAGTKRTGRSMRRLAPFSMANFGSGTSAALIVEAVCAEAPVTASAAAETPKASASRRVMSFFMVFSLMLVPGLQSPVNRCSRTFCVVLAVGTAIHADRLPAAERGFLQNRRVDAAYRPHSGQYQ